MNNISVVEVKFKGSVPPKKKPISKGVKASRKQSRPEKPGRKLKFVTKVELNDLDREILRQVIVNQELACKEAERVMQDRPNIPLGSLKAIVASYVKEQRLTPVIMSMINVELYYIHKFIRTGRKLDRSGSKHLTYIESSLYNRRFSMARRRTKIVLEDIDLTLKLAEPIPVLPPDKDFYMNISVNDLDKLQDVTLTIFYNTSSDKTE